MRGIDVLDQGDLIACRTTLARDNRAVGKEILPNLAQRISSGLNVECSKSFTYSEPPVAVLGDNFLLVRHPVAIPSPKRSRVVHTNCVDTLDLESGTFERIDELSERR